MGHLPGRRASRRVLRRMLLEFGSAEVLDGFVIRPLCLAAGLELIGGAAGAVAGKIAADVAFYGQVMTIRRWSLGPGPESLRRAVWRATRRHQGRELTHPPMPPGPATAT